MPLQFLYATVFLYTTVNDYSAPPPYSSCTLQLQSNSAPPPHTSCTTCQEEWSHIKNSEKAIPSSRVLPQTGAAVQHREMPLFSTVLKAAQRMATIRN